MRACRSLFACRSLLACRSLFACRTLFAWWIGWGAGLFALGLPAAPLEEASIHPVAARLITAGFDVSATERVQLPPPLVRPGMSARQQQVAIERLVGKTRMRQFFRDSQVARHELKVPTLRRLADGSTVRGFDLAFIVYGDLSAISERQSNQPNAWPTDGSFATRFEPLDARPSPAEAIEWSQQPRLYRYRFPLLDKVIISGLVRGQAVITDDQVVQTMFTPADYLNDKQNPSVWQAIPRGAKSDSELAPPQPFVGMASYMQATGLKFRPGALLVETHAIYVEPQGWFDGRNLLASKLPLVMQEGVRQFRRELAKNRQQKNRQQ